ncbi:MAG: phosphatidylglycerol lysyltransferase domain-containing protein [Candidatus Omnitrophica bacterium]|nr:phosphatidylglycerol lysyltransferase domain-containing protein [Candidatus Omnitrophota bacterium]
MKQFIPSECCLKCDVCCRFLDAESPYAAGLDLTPEGNRFTQPLHAGAGFICSCLNPKNNRCKIYVDRPLDCKLYPFVLMWDEDYKDIVLGLDHKCPHIANCQLPITNYRQYFPPTLKSIDPQCILRFQDDIEILEKLNVRTEPALNKLLIGDMKLFSGYASRVKNPLSSYSFIANYLWTDLLGYYWTIIDGNFCLFCKGAGSFFMPIPPLGREKVKNTVRRCFEIMGEFNKNRNLSRIEEIKGEDTEAYKKIGYNIKEKGSEYICRQADLADLAGDKYKAKRALCNYFVKNYKSEYREFRAQDEAACLKLFKEWQVQRVKGPGEGGYYNALMEDAYTAHKKTMDRYAELGLSGRVVLVNGKISAYTFGYKLDHETFTVLLEIADLKIKGLAQFIFREFSKEMKGFKYINIMDDSGLENLKAVKLSYHPVKIEKTYCAYCNNPEIYYNSRYA